MKIYPICSESFGVRSFCVKVSTPDLSIILDPGCALGPVKNFKIPHPLEYEGLYEFTDQIVYESQECSHIFISHYHHDHFKPLMNEEMYIHTSNEIFESLYRNKMILCKQYRKTNYNQKQRGIKFRKDLEHFNSRVHRINWDDLEDKSIFQRNCSSQLSDGISDSTTIGDTHLLFPREFLHGMRMDGKQIKIQPLIIINKNEFFYFFPDVQGFPSPDDLELLLLLKTEIEKIHNKFISNSKTTHIIALGGPITYLLRQQRAYHLLEQSVNHSRKVIQHFDQVFIDHHLMRDRLFYSYWNKIQGEMKNCRLFNERLLLDMKMDRKKPLVLEIFREELYNTVKMKK